MKWFKVVIFSIIGLLLLVIGWGLIEPYTIGVSQYEVTVPNLPDQMDGVKFAVISDFQVGFWLDNISTIERIVDQIVDTSPEFVLILGDFIYHGGEVAEGRIAKAAQLVKPMTQANIPVYAVLGNHDYSAKSNDLAKIDYERAENLTHALEESGVTVLVNENDEFSSNFYIVGIGSYTIRNAKIGESFEGVPESAARVVMLHNPTIFGDIPGDHAPLAFAGHTHGGQISIPFTPNWSVLNYFIKEDIHFDGWIKDYGQTGNQLYVNRGIGFSVVPLRISASPELTFITLK